MKNINHTKFLFKLESASCESSSYFWIIHGWGTQHGKQMLTLIAWLIILQNMWMNSNIKWLHVCTCSCLESRNVPRSSQRSSCRGYTRPDPWSSAQTSSWWTLAACSGHFQSRRLSINSVRLGCVIMWWGLYLAAARVCGKSGAPCHSRETAPGQTPVWR